MSTDYTQQGRRVAINTPLGEDALLLIAFNGREEMSRLFRFELEMLSEKESIAAKDIVGKNVSFFVKSVNDEIRYFNGFVSRFAYCGKNDRLSLYRAEVVPWMWFLTRTADCRIFQDKTTPQIIEQVFKDLGFTNFETAEIKGSYPKREYCVQYRETDFNFVSRLMEEEGIFYYFRHENGKHTLVLADQKGAYKDCAEKEVELASNLSGLQITDQVYSWEHGYEFRSGKWTHTDYNFETPTASMMANTNTVVKIDNNTKLELYDYPGEYLKKNEGESLAKVRMEEEEAPYDVVHGASMCRSFGPGGKFKMTKHHCPAEEGKSYVITSINHSVHLPGAYVSGAKVNDKDYENTFTCIPDSVTFRPARLTPHPAIHGSQTAAVVGPKGEEIYTDKYGRIKVQFHWDREGKKDEKSSCWIRVAQIWAGKKWGAVFLPRIGQEVVVSFLEGDPDRPLITGSVYNAEHMPPYTLADNKTISTIKSNSSKGSEGFNEVRFEDKKGEEQIFIHGEKNEDIRIKNDAFEWIGHDRHLIVKNMQIEHIEVDRHETIDRDHQEKIGRDRHTEIDGKEAKSVAGTLSLKVTGNVAEEFKANHSELVAGDYYVKGQNIVIEALTNVTIKVGQSYIAIEASGVKIGTTGTIELESTGPLSAKSQAQVEVKGPQVSVQADAMLTLKGGTVMIN